MSLRTIVLGGLGLGLSVALTAGLTVTASAQPSGLNRTPSPAAARAGVTAAGGGYAGWATRSHQLQSPNIRSQSISPMTTSSTVLGIDVSSYQGTVNWAGWYTNGRRFAYIKATEGTSYTSPYFNSQFSGAYAAGFIRGAYHFGRPDGASGAAQAQYFVAHGGAWTANGRTLPGVLDIEDNYTGVGNRCWGKTPYQTRHWITSFLNEYKYLTGRDAVIYTNKSYWQACVSTGSYHNTNPLWIAYWSSTPLTALPGGWPFWTFWQYSGTGTDQDRFSASLTRLRALALG